MAGKTGSRRPKVRDTVAGNRRMQMTTCNSFGLLLPQSPRSYRASGRLDASYCLAAPRSSAPWMAPARGTTIIPWIGRPLMDVGSRSENQAAKIVAAWEKSSVLIPGKPHKATNRTTIQTLTTNQPKVAEILNCHPVRQPDE
jgi:hypothetical protein